MEIYKIGLCIVLIIMNIEGKMVVQSPSELSNFFNQKYPDGSIPYSIANYGIVPYGKVISGQIGIPQFLEDCIYEQIPDNARKNIMLVERNDCTFTQKSINVQKQGGKLAIIMDNRVEKPENLVMTDDGKGHFVTIPTVLISKEDGQKILEYIDLHPVISVTFQLKQKQKTDLTIWIDILDHKNFIFLRSFQPYFNRLADSINFNVSYPTNRCTQGCLQSNCFYSGKYCRYPHGFWGVENGGQQVIREQLRQFHVFKENPTKWWTYMLQFDDRCNDLATYYECSSKILNKIGIQPKYINSKVDQSFSEEDNLILQDLSNQKYTSAILYYPSIVINSMIYRGNLEPFEVFEVICDSINPTPSGCSQDPNQSNSHLSTWIFFGVISVLLFAIFLIVCFRRIARRQLSTEMNKKVNELVNEYISMYEVQKFKQGQTQMKNRG